ncbi:MAG: hypothetical protein WC254_01785, partial [Candidatus Woesearchaeota archaeon]
MDMKNYFGKTLRQFGLITLVSFFGYSTLAHAEDIPMRFSQGAGVSTAAVYALTNSSNIPTTFDASHLEVATEYFRSGSAQRTREALCVTKGLVGSLRPSAGSRNSSDEGLRSPALNIVYDNQTYGIDSSKLEGILTRCGVVTPVAEVKPYVAPSVPVAQAPAYVAPSVPVAEAKPYVAPSVPVAEAKPYVAPSVPKNTTEGTTS